MYKIMLDTNVVVDCLMGRTPACLSSADMLALVDAADAASR